MLAHADTLGTELRRASAGQRTARGKLIAAIPALFRSAQDDVLLYETLVLPPSSRRRTTA